MLDPRRTMRNSQSAKAWAAGTVPRHAAGRKRRLASTIPEGSGLGELRSVLLALDIAYVGGLAGE
jgi:galactokinase